MKPINLKKGLKLFKNIHKTLMKPCCVCRPRDDGPVRWPNHFLKSNKVEEDIKMSSSHLHQQNTRYEILILFTEITYREEKTGKLKTRSLGAGQRWTSDASLFKSSCLTRGTAAGERASRGSHHGNAVNFADRRRASCSPATGRQTRQQHPFLCVPCNAR